MSERLSPEDLATDTLSAFQEEAASNKLRSELLVKDGHFGDAATHQRMAEVYRSTAEDLEVVIKKFKRDLERSMNPCFKDSSDAEIDRMIERNDKRSANIESHHVALI
jgi:TATA-binding protein-associated factor Taf7